MKTTINDRPPNWRDGEQLFLKRCYACAPDHGRENWAFAVAKGQCAWCGWKEETEKVEEKPESKKHKLERCGDE